MQGGKSYAYNVTAVDNGGQKGTRSLTEYGKALLQSPANIKAIANKNAISLEWSAVENASSYNVFRDDDLINTTTELEYSDYKLKFDEEYSYTIVSVDHHQEEGPKSSSKSVTTHKEVKKIKKIKAEAGESIVDLEWTKHDLAVIYRIYQNGTLIDSSKTINTLQKLNLEQKIVLLYLLSISMVLKVLNLYLHVIKLSFHLPKKFHFH